MTSQMYAEKISALDEILGKDDSGDANYAKSLAESVAKNGNGGGGVPALNSAGKQKRQKIK